MTILTVNTGSSSIRLAMFAPGLGRLADAYYPGAGADPTARLKEFLRDYDVPRVTVVAHRIVHGGSRLIAPCLLDDDVETEIRRLAPLAPLHNPLALAWLAASRAVLGETVAQVAVFDTAFYANLPEVAATYALPREFRRKHSIRRYGFHGLAHQALWQRWRELRPEVRDGGRAISLQLGAGCSITAVNCGRPVDTSMGFSPLEGLVMATRCGDIDPGLLMFLQRAEGLTTEQLEHLLNHESGLLGLSGASADMQRLLESQDPLARLAV